MIALRNLEPHELARLAEIDRSEQVALHYHVDAGTLLSEAVDWQVPRWSAEQVEGYVHKYGPVVEAGGLCVVAEDILEDGALLAGIAVLGAQPVPTHPALLQLLFFHVSRPHRRTGVGRRMFERVQAEARRRGAGGLYISAAPTGSAVGFYLSRGARPVAPDPALLAAEPEDIHLALMLQQ